MTEKKQKKIAVHVRIIFYIVVEVWCKYLAHRNSRDKI